MAEAGGTEEGACVLQESGHVRDQGSGGQGRQPCWPALRHCPDSVCREWRVLARGSRWFPGVWAESHDGRKGIQFRNKRLGPKHGRTVSSESPRQGLWQGP